MEWYHGMKFRLHDKVNKVGGKYQGPGEIVGWTAPLDDFGYRLYNVAMKVEGGKGRFVHVFPETVLEPVNE